MSLLQEIKPKNARTKRFLENRAPKIIENPKQTLLLRGSPTSAIINSAIADLHSLKLPLSVKFSKKNENIHPFEDAGSLEFFSRKNNAALLVFGSHSKKRPHCLTLVRMFDHQVLDMLELLVTSDTFKAMADFKGKKPAIGLKPMLAFSGTGWDDPAQKELGLAKSLFLDLFRGREVGQIDVEGLQYLISLSVAEAGDGEEAKPRIHFRAYLIRTKKSGQKVPRVEVEEMGPRMDFKVGRVKEADEAIMKEAMKKPKGLEARQKKNVETDIVGDKVGRIHLGRQDLSTLQTRKMKGLKRTRASDAAEFEEDSEDGGVELTTKKTRR